MTTNHGAAISIIKSLIGQANILTIPRVFVDFMGSLDGALFLSQIIYWSDRANSEWFYKTYNEWQDEICLSKYEVSKHSKALQEMGLLETKLKKANGAPTVHYKFLFDEFEKSFVKFLDNRKLKNLTIECEESEQSITETTTETTTKKKDIKPNGLKPPKTKSKKPKTKIPPAIKVYQETARRYPDKTLWPLIEETIGDDLELWQQVVFNYIACGWNKMNIKTMLEFYRRGEIPHVKQNGKGKTNGTHKQSTLDDQPGFDPYTGEYVLPDGTRTTVMP